MASPGAPNPLPEQYSVQSAISTALRQAYLHRPRTRRAKITYIAAFTFLLLILLSSRNSDKRPIPNYWTVFPTLPSFHERPEDSAILSPHSPPVRVNGTLPSNLQKVNPSFHLLIPATRRSPGLCRTVTSAMILNYPPPTLVSYEKQLPDGSKEYDSMVDRITGIYNYLAQTNHVHDHDYVLIVDGFDSFFQLPPEVMIRRFQNILRKNNLKLRKKYGLATVQSSDNSDGVEWVQKYTQRVLFGASKLCFPNLTDDAGCASVPSSTLPPDVYGWKTDIHPDGHLNRPRWLNPGTVIGQVADLKQIYGQVLEFIKRRRNKNGDYLALTQIYGRQEYVRELERRRTSSRIMQWLYRQIGISDASNMTGVTTSLEAGRRYEFGIGVDYESQLFFNMLHSRNDVEWLRYNNISKTSTVQQEHGVPRERRLLLPDDLAEDIENPFTLPKYTRDEVLKPPYNATIDALPDPKKVSWHNLPLMTNIHSASVPALAHLNGDESLRDAWWSKMWYHPWTRALLRKYARSPRGHSAAESSLLGGQDWWDMRGGRGGVWTDRGEWIDFPDLCGGYEYHLFDDDFGVWGQEDGGEFEKPLYNQWGHLIKGKGPENVDPPQ